MYRVLLVDDEPSIREGLKTLIDWNRHGFVVCGDAVNGKDGLRRCAELQPDVVVADIRMPGMDGLQMIEEIIKRGMSCRFIILTGYSEFHYARKAIDFGVDSYLLKPVDPGELLDKLSRLRTMLDQEKVLREQRESSLALQRERLLQSILLGDPSAPDDPSFAAALPGLDFPWKSYQVFLTEIEPKPDAAVRHTVQQRLQSRLEAESLGYAFNLDDYTAVLSKDVSPAAMKPLLAELRSGILAEFGHDLVVCSGAKVKEASQINASYEGAKTLSRNKFILRPEDDFLIEEQTDEKRRFSASALTATPVQAYDPGKAAEKLAFAIDAGDVAIIRQRLDEAAGGLLCGAWSPESVTMQLALLYVTAIHQLIHANEPLRDLLSPYLAIQSELYEHRTLEGLLAYIHAKLSELSDTLHKDRPGAALLNMLDFIRRHYNKELKLEALAEMFHYNSSYLGKLFKQQTGESFNTYLDRLRIEGAKQLLRQGWKVHQTAEKVGYANVDYFCGKFKKYVGMPPSAYREHPE